MGFNSAFKGLMNTEQERMQKEVVASACRGWTTPL
jgi:hypothetical protein